jgi:Bacterial PH domain
MIDEYENEKIRGLPEDLPAGEKLLWQGSPNWRSLACHMVHANKVAGYFALLALWSIASALNDGGTISAALFGVVRVTLVGSLGIGLLCLIAWLTARTTVYSITSRRIVMRMGIVLPMTMNLPFRSIGGAGVANYKDGTGDIALSIASGDRIAFLHLWPHVRPWRINNPEPALRSIPDARSVSVLLGEALMAFAASHPELKPAASKLVLFPVGRPAKNAGAGSRTGVQSGHSQLTDGVGGIPA